MFSMYNPNKLALNDPLEFNGFDFAIAYVYFLFPKTLKKKKNTKKTASYHPTVFLTNCVNSKAKDFYVKELVSRWGNLRIPF